jgi:hypothetical protein
LHNGLSVSVNVSRDGTSPSETISQAIRIESPDHLSQP